MIGSLFALLAAISFALSMIFLRRAVLKVSEASAGTLISVPMAVPLFFLFLVFTDNLRSILYFSSQSYVWLSLAGVFHLVIGRSLSYKSTQLVGANITSILRRVNIFITVLIGIFLLHEPLSWRLGIGVFLIIIGITITGSRPQTLQTSYGQFSKIKTKAFIPALGCGMAWGLSPIFIKLGLKNSEFPIAGAFISFLVASAILSISLVNSQRRFSLFHMTGGTITLFFIDGFLTFTAHLFFYMALNLSPASFVSPLVSTSPIFQLLFSFLFNRKIEIISIPVIIGTILGVLGTLIIF